VAAANPSLRNTRIKANICTMAHWQDFAIIAWQSRADGATAREVTEFADLLIEECETFSIVHVVEGSAGLPTPEGRDELVAAAKKNNQHVACVGVLMPESQVIASMLRVFVRGFRTLLRGALGTVVEGDLTTLARKVAEIHGRRTNAAIDAGELESAITSVRRLHSR